MKSEADVEVRLVKGEEMNLFIGNLHRDVIVDDLDELFRGYGKIVSVKVWRNSKTGDSLGYGFVEIQDDYQAERAINVLNNTLWRGKRLRVSEAQERTGKKVAKNARGRRWS
jgi:RNA recognition motif-containing protein